jgi:hypothetical protein
MGAVFGSSRNWMTHTRTSTVRTGAPGRTVNSVFGGSRIGAVADSKNPRSATAMRTPHLRGPSGFSLAETAVAMGVTVVSLLGFYFAAGQAVRIVRSGKEVACASEMLQQRIETFRFTPPWSNLTTVSGITSIVSVPTAASQNLSGVTETFRITPYPAGGTPLVVTRSPNGVITSSGTDLSTHRCVELTVETSWTGSARTPKSRQISTIVARGGL